ncbi:EAL domain-containing protein [Paraburkholderia caribensis]|uniref:EAL domain-containing protein n=1 Tax=Paraburkholderia caribensis TaxID=75105 RepID=UPI0034D1935B
MGLPSAYESSAMHIAFQPIVSIDGTALTIYGYEALARDSSGRVPNLLIQKGTSEHAYALDYQCRKQAIRDAVALRLACNLSMNLLPGAACHPRFGIDATVAEAHALGFPVDRIMIEITEREIIEDYASIRQCFDRYREQGVKLALDDFGTGFNGLNTLLELRPDVLKVDATFVQKIETDDARQALMFAICSGSERLGTRILAEGAETAEGVAALIATDIKLMQGFFFAKPCIGKLPDIEPRLMDDVCNYCFLDHRPAPPVR